MATDKRICYPLIKMEEKNVEKVIVPSGATYRAGDVVMCEVLDTTDSDNREVYLGSAVSNITTDYPCIIINQGFEQLADGRRPDGEPNLGKFEYFEGEVVTAVRLEKDLKFYLSEACLDNTGVVAPAVGVKLITQAADYQLATAAAFGTAVTGLNVEKLEAMPQGGLFGADFEDGVITRVILGR